GRCQQSQVLAVLLVNPLDVLCDHQLDARAQLRIGTLLTATAFAATLAAHRRHKTTTLYIATHDGNLIAALQTEIWDLTQRLIEIKTIVRRRDLVSGD